MIVDINHAFHRAWQPSRRAVQRQDIHLPILQPMQVEASTVVLTGPRCSLPESAGAGKGGLFLGRLDQGLVGNAESTHVDRPKGKAPLVPDVGRYCNIIKRHIVIKPATSMLSRLIDLVKIGIEHIVSAS